MNTEHIAIDPGIGVNEGNARVPIWTRELTYCLIDEMRRIELRDDRHKIKKRMLYEELSAKFATLNFQISWKGVQKKWQNLMSSYWKYYKLSADEVKWEYYNELDGILSGTDLWVGLNGCKDPKIKNSLHYADKADERLWTNERILFLLDEMRENLEEHSKFRRSLYHQISQKFQRMGVNIDWKLIQKKWHNMYCTYKKNRIKMRDQVSWEYFDAMGSVFSKHDRLSFKLTSDQNAPEKGQLADTEWTDDHVFILLEEMMTIKERKDKYVLTKQVAFREISTIFSEQNISYDWRQILRKWQSMNLIYSKMVQGLMDSNEWKFFHLMHSIVGDSDEFAGIGVEHFRDVEPNPSVPIKMENDAYIYEEHIEEEDEFDYPQLNCADSQELVAEAGVSHTYVLASDGTLSRDYEHNPFVITPDIQNEVSQSRMYDYRPIINDFIGFSAEVSPMEVDGTENDVNYNMKPLAVEYITCDERESRDCEYESVADTNMQDISDRKTSVIEIKLTRTDEVVESKNTRSLSL